MTRILRPLTLAAALLLSAGTAAAQGRGNGNGNGNGRGRPDRDGRAERVVVTRDGRVDDDRDDGRFGDRDGDRRGWGTRRVPPGLAKKGGLPPGQARRAGVRRVRVDDGVFALRDVFGRNGYTVVRTVPAGASRYVYYRGADGLVRRAVVRPGDGRLGFANVPGDIVTAVLARLY